MSFLTALTLHAQASAVPDVPLPRGERHTLLKVVRPDLLEALSDSFEPGPALAEQETEDEQDMRFRRVEAPGGTITILHAFDSWHCGASGNCAVWVLDGRHRVLLRNLHPRRIAVLPQSHHGLPDLFFSIHDSASEQQWLWLRFTGRRYVLYDCETRTQTFDLGRTVQVDRHVCNPG